MAIDISDMEVADDMHLGDRLPIEILFRAIEERWSVVADRLEDLPAHPLAYDRFPTRQDRLDAIRANICALAPHFVNLDDDANQPTGWARCPMPYSVADIARSGLGEDGHGQVLLVPARGTVWSEFAEGWYKPFLKSAAFWLAKFRYVFAGPWTCYRGKLARSVEGKWYDGGPTDWLSGAWLYTEGYTINGEEHMTTYDGGVWTRCADYTTVATEAAQNAEAIVQEAMPEKPHWGIPSTGIPIETNAQARVTRIIVTSADGTWADRADDWTWCTVIDFSFGISGVPARVAVANPFGYRAELLFVYAPIDTVNGERVQGTTVWYFNGYTSDTWREILGDFHTSESYEHSSGVWAKRFRADYDPATARRVVVEDEHNEAPPLDRNGTTVDVFVSRDYEPDSFGVFPVGDPDAPDGANQAFIPGGKDNRIEHRRFLEPGELHEDEFGEIDKDQTKGKLLVTSSFDMQAIVDDARSVIIDNGPGDNPNKPTHPGFEPSVSYGGQIVYSHAGCRIVPILDFGDVFKTNEEEEIEDWTGNRPHDDDEGEEGEEGGEEE